MHAEEIVRQTAQQIAVLREQMNEIRRQGLDLYKRQERYYAEVVIALTREWAFDTGAELQATAIHALSNDERFKDHWSKLEHEGDSLHSRMDELVIKMDQLRIRLAHPWSFLDLADDLADDLAEIGQRTTTP